MPLTIACPCGQHYAVEDRYAGQQTTCPMCGQLLSIPMAAPAYAPPPAYDSAPRRGGGLLALLVALLVIFTFAGGLVGFVVWLANQESTPVAQGDPPPKHPEPPAPPPPPPPPEREKPILAPPDREVPAPPPPPPVRTKLPSPSDRPWEGHLASVMALGLEPGGRWLWSAAGGVVERDGKTMPVSDCTLRRWDASTGKEVDRIELTENGLLAAAFAADGKLAAVSIPGRTGIELWDLSTKKKLATLDGAHTKPIHALAFGPGARRLVSGGDDRTLGVWDVPGRKLLHRLSGHDNTLTALAVSADGKHAISGSIDLSARLWDIERGEAVRVLAGHEDIVWATAFSADGKQALTGGGLHQIGENLFRVGASDYAVRLWEMNATKEKARLQPLAGAVTALGISPDGRRLLAGGHDGALKLWQVGSNKQVKNLEGHTARVRAVVFFPDGRKAISGSDDRSLRVWDLPADLPDLIRDLKSNELRVRFAALAELNRLGKEAAPGIPTFFDLLADRDRDLRTRVLDLLRGLSPLDKEHVLRLARLLEKKYDAPARLFALDELARLGEDARPAAKALLAGLEDENAEVRRKSLTALAPIIDEVGKSAYRPLLGALRDRDAGLRVAAAKALEKLGSPPAEHLPSLRTLLALDEEPLRRFALKAMAEMGEGAAIAMPDITDRVRRDKSADIRAQAIQTLAKVAPKDERSIRVAVQALEDKDASVSREAAKLLAGAGDVAGLITALEHRDEEVSKAAASALDRVRFTKKHVPLLVKLVESRSAEVRRRAVEGLAEFGADGAAAVPGLCKVLKDAEEDEQKRILAVLAKMGKSAEDAGATVADLLKLTRDRARQFELCRVLIKIESPEVRRAIGSLIEQLRPESAEDAGDEDAVKQRDKARDLLVQIGKPAVKRLLTALEEDFVGGGKTSRVLNAYARVEVLKVLKDMGPTAKGAETLQVLARVQKNDGVPEVREAAREAYVRVQRKE